MLFAYKTPVRSYGKLSAIILGAYGEMFILVLSQPIRKKKSYYFLIALIACTSRGHI